MTIEHGRVDETAADNVSGTTTTRGPRYGLEVLLGILAILGAFFSAFLWIDGHYARTTYVDRVGINIKTIEHRLDLKIIDDQLQSTRNQIFDYEDQLGIKPDDETVRKLLRSLRKSEKDLEQEKESILRALKPR